jgi:hypothetical protein
MDKKDKFVENKKLASRRTENQQGSQTKSKKEKKINCAEKSACCLWYTDENN